MVKHKPLKGSADDEIDEMVFDAPLGADEAEVTDIEEDARDELKKYKEKLKACQKERSEYLDGWQRSKADYLNQKRRLEMERKEESERNAAHFVQKLLPLCDSFDTAVRNVASEQAKGEWRVGIEQIYNQLLGIVRSYNVEVLEPTGKPFDPHFHEAVSETAVTDPAQHHIILNVLQKGYLIGERLIRPAKVVVGRYEAP